MGKRRSAKGNDYPVYVRNSDGANFELVYQDKDEAVIRPPGCPNANKIMSHATLEKKFQRVAS